MASVQTPLLPCSASASASAPSERLSLARQTFLSGRTRPLSWRKHQLRQFLLMLTENASTFASALGQDLRKPRQESLTMELEHVCNNIRFVLDHLDAWAEDEHVEKSLVTLLDSTYVHREPLGVVLILGAWNYPLLLTLSPAIGALAAGNCVFLKPPELAPATSSAIEKLTSAYLDPDCFHVIQGGIPETAALLKLRFDYIFFTGSVRVAKIVGAAANEHLTPATMECGGKCPIFFDDSVDMRVAVKRMIWGKMVGLGQTCVAPDYVLCTPQAKDKLIKTVQEVYKEFYGEDSSLTDDLSRIIDDRNFGRLEKIVRETRGRVIFGGQFDHRDERFLPLTLVEDPPADDSVMSEELFGPILPIITVADAAEAVQFINARPKPLSLYIMSTRKSTKQQLIQNTSSGSVCCNDVIVHLSVDSLPFGGVGDSGYGSYHGKYSFDTFSHCKAVVVRDYNFIGEYLGLGRYPPYSEKKTKMVSWVTKSRSLPKIPGFVWGLGLGIGLFILAKFLVKNYLGLDLPEWL